MAGVRQAYPEVAASVRTAQLAHRLLARKAAFVGDLGRSGVLRDLPTIASLPRLVRQPCMATSACRRAAL